MRYAVVGSTGLIGRHLVSALVARGDEVVALSRQPANVAGLATTAWDPAHSELPAHVLEGVDVVVNLAGAPLGPARWTRARRAALLASRVTTTRALARAIVVGGPSVLLNASAVGVYGSTEDLVEESSPPGTGFLAEVCVEWEREALAARDAARVVLLRTGVVLARDGGALPPLARLARFGLAGRIGSGQQWLSWIHIRDEVGAILRCATDDALVGPVNLVAPGAVRQREFADALGRCVHRRRGPPVPGALLRAGLGEAASLLCDGQRVTPAALARVGFTPAFGDLDDALVDLVDSPVR